MLPGGSGRSYVKLPGLVRRSGSRFATGRAASRISRPRRGSTTTEAFGPDGRTPPRAEATPVDVATIAGRRPLGRQLRRRVEPPRRRPARHPGATFAYGKGAEALGATSLTVLRRTGKETFQRSSTGSTPAASSPRSRRSPAAADSGGRPEPGMPIRQRLNGAWHGPGTCLSPGRTLGTWPFPSGTCSRPTTGASSSTSTSGGADGRWRRCCRGCSSSTSRARASSPTARTAPSRAS